MIFQSQIHGAPAPDAAGSSFASMDRRENLAYRDFVEEYLRPNKPVVVTDAVGHWAALKKWTPDFFRREYGPMDLEMGGLTMGELIDLVERSEREPVDDLPYLRNRSVHRDFPELEPDISPLPIYLRPNWFNNPLVPRRISHHRTDLFIGGRGCRFPYLHFDNYHGYAFVFQIYGEKEFLLIPPEQTPLVYPCETRNGISNASSIPDIEHPDLEEFPLFAKATPTRCVLEPGEMLFIAAGWWHTARMHKPSISISSNTANAFNWTRLMSDHWKSFKTRPARALAAVPYLSLIWLWESLRDVSYRNRALNSPPLNHPQQPEPLQAS